MKAILSVLVMLGLPAAFWNYFLRETPDVRYSLSAAIPIAFQEAAKGTSTRLTNDELVQQVEVANTGKAEAKRIVIKTPRSITQFHLVKHSASEQVEVFNTSDGFELVYPSLPPSSGFQITLKTSGLSLTENDLAVFHQTGKARSVSPGSRSSEASAWSLLSIPFLAVYLWIGYVSFRDELKYRLLFRRYSSDVGELLRNSKPWYIRVSDWPEVLEDLLRRALSESMALYMPISSSTPYMFLSNDKPEAIPQGSWDKLKEIANARLLELARAKANSAYDCAEILDLLNTQWPSGVTESNRGSVINAISFAYFNRLIDSSTAEELVKILERDQKPSSASLDAWEKFRRKAAIEIAQDIGARLLNEENIESVEKSPVWELISYSQREHLKRLHAGRIAAAEAGEQLGKAKALKDEVFAEKLNLTSRESDVSRGEARVTASRSKVYRQLEIIERVLADPTYLDRIEPEDDSFVAGNWVLLRKLVNGRS